jgi:hypothetical protein
VEHPVQQQHQQQLSQPLLQRVVGLPLLRVQPRVAAALSQTA